MKKRIFSIVMSLVLIMSFMPAMTFTSSASDEVTLIVDSMTANDSAARAPDAKYKTIKGALKNAKAGDTIKLESDITEKVLVADGKAVTLDLNDHVLKGDGTNSVITNSGSLTITDTALNKTDRYFTDKDGDGCFETLETDYDTANKVKGTDYVAVTGGVITGGKGSYGGAIRSNASETSSVSLTISGGNLVGNKAKFGGAVSSADYKNEANTAKFAMTGGVVAGNLAVNDMNNAYGGGLYIKGKDINMLNGEVSYNTAASSAKGFKAAGGGLYISSSEMFTISNMSIIGNVAKAKDDCLKANGGGIMASGTSTLEIKDCIIKDNKAVVNGTNAADTIIAYGGGLHLSQDVTLSGNTKIQNNSAEVLTELNTENSASLRQGFGGGVYVSSGKEDDKNMLIIKDADVEISGNTAKSTFKAQGGGLYVANNTVSKLSAGSIINNKVVVTNPAHIAEEEGGGVCVTYKSSEFIVGGTLKIMDNTGSDETVKNNVYLRKEEGKEAIITIGNSTDGTDGNEVLKLEEAMQIGIFPESNAVDTSATVDITGESGIDYSRYFTSDSDDYIVKLTDTGTSLVFLQCTYSVPLTIGEQMLLLGGKEAGCYTITGNKVKGFQIKNENDEYLAVVNGELKTDSTSAFTWKYDGGLYVETKSGVKTKFPKVIKQYLSFDGTNLALSSSKVTACVQERSIQHTYKYIHNGDGYHVAVCIKCGKHEAKEKHSYDNKNHKCVCGKLDPAQVKVSKVSLHCTSIKSYFGIIWKKSVAKYQNNIINILDKVQGK